MFQSVNFDYFFSENYYSLVTFNYLNSHLKLTIRKSHYTVLAKMLLFIKSILTIF